MKVAALDLGTNSFLCLIAEVKAGQITEIYDDQVEIVRLGQDVNKTKRFHPDALARARSTLTNFSRAIQSHKPERILAMATSAARDVSNGDELFKIGRELHIPIEIIPGEREAEITFKGSVSGLPDTNTSRIVIDIGGGSTEIIKGTGRSYEFGESINIGAVRLTEMFVPHQPAKAEERKALEDYIQKELSPLLEKIKASGVTEAIAVAGTPTELARVELGRFDPDEIDSYTFSAAKLQKWTDTFATTSVEEKLQLGVTKGRADVIYAGVSILNSIVKSLNLKEIKVSTRGVRYGVAIELEQRA